MKLERWLEGLETLSPTNQLKVAKAIREELNFNRRDLDNQKDQELSKLLEEFFSTFEKMLEEDNEFSEYKNIPERITNLSKNSQYKLFKVIFCELKICEKDDVQAKKEQICKENGHKYTEWKRHTWTTRTPVWDAGLVGYMDVEHSCWSRKCKRCGFYDKSGIEPDEEYEERKRKEKEEEIKRLEKRLEELKK